ncbi:MAG: 6,7-dimethyl-8-ribityllumazine synthase [Bdellovibrionales bacterium]|nr:6,7-dimethyl-8-ribityllumazine synthase [Bdellovibrionales bacterium]
MEGNSKATALGKVAVITSRFNWEITELLEKGAIQYLKAAGLHESQISILRVPGAFEIPLAAKACLQQGVDGVIALGAVIRGDTTHYTSVCEAVERGCTQLQLEYTKPVAFGVITTENEDQAYARAGGAHGNKGADAALVCLEMIDLLAQLGRRGRS